MSEIDLLAELELADDPCPRGCGRSADECEEAEGGGQCAGSPLVQRLERNVTGLLAEIANARQAFDAAIAQRDIEAKASDRMRPIIEAAKAWRERLHGNPWADLDPVAIALVAAVDGSAAAEQSTDVAARCAVEAAAPIIERQVRAAVGEEIAQSLLAAGQPDPARWMISCADAAAIARGHTQATDTRQNPAERKER